MALRPSSYRVTPVHFYSPSILGSGAFSVCDCAGTLHPRKVERCALRCRYTCLEVSKVSHAKYKTLSPPLRTMPRRRTHQGPLAHSLNVTSVSKTSRPCRCGLNLFQGTPKLLKDTATTAGLIGSWRGSGAFAIHFRQTFHAAHFVFNL
jgi:hypothetical protein